MSPTVLIVDDSLTVRMDLLEAFRAADFRATPCESGQQAREALIEALESAALNPHVAEFKTGVLQAATQHLMSVCAKNPSETMFDAMHDTDIKAF